MLSLAPPDTAVTLMTLGLMFLIGLVADLLGRFTPLPRVSLLLLAGLLIGPAGLDVLPAPFIADWFPPLTSIALAMIGFLLGQKVTIPALRARGSKVIAISIGEVLGASTLVTVVLLVIGVDLPVALLLGGIAPATAPAATYDVVKETGSKGEFADTLLGVVAIDDAWGLIVFSLLAAVVGTLADGVTSAGSGLVAGLTEVGGSAVLGIALGVPMAYMTGRIRAGEPSLAEALGLVLLCAGLSTWFEVSPILAAMVLGATVSSLAKHHNRPFHAIEDVEWPFMIMFFVLAGASLEVESLLAIGGIGAAYMLARCAGLYLGARTGARIGGADPTLRRWLGLALMPQAGVALGMALLAAQRFPEQADVVLTVVLASTVIFELTAPILTRWVLRRVAALDAGD